MASCRPATAKFFQARDFVVFRPTADRAVAPDGVARGIRAEDDAVFGPVDNGGFVAVDDDGAFFSEVEGTLGAVEKVMW
ncbi:MAG: hypothetical protein ACQKBY_01045 [Verrucomicrobiales bacterium]